MTSTTQDRIFGFTVTVAVKAPTRVATHAENITLSGLQTIDGVTLVEDDRVLVKDQTDATENGIYVAKEGAWKRTGDFNGARDVTSGTLVRVASGTVNANSYWSASSGDDPIVIGTSEITWTPDNNVLGEGVLEEGVVTAFSLSSEVRSLIAANTNYAGEWATSTAYTAGDTVSKDGVLYMVTTDHTSGTFATDLAAEKLIAISGQRFSLGSDIASGSSLGVNVVGIFHDVTGTTNITGFASIDTGVSPFKVLQFDGALTITHSSNLVLPNSTNYTTKAGEILMFYEFADGQWRMISTSRSLNYGQGGTENFNMKDKVLQRPTIKDYGETVYDHGDVNGSVTVDLENGNVQKMTVTDTTTIQFSNWPSSGKMGSVTLIIKQDSTGGRSVGFTGIDKWSTGGDTKPELSSDANLEDWIVVASIDGGTTINAFVSTIGLGGDESNSSVGSQSDPGYTTLPSGKILQWGEEEVPSNGQQAFTFPIPFPSVCYQVSGTGQQHDPGEVDSAAVGALAGWDTDGATLWNNNNTTITVSWWAIGE